METVYVYLPKERVEVWAPVDAEHVRDDIYRVIDCRGEDDEVQFGNGTLVRCRREQKMHGVRLVKALVAFEKVLTTTD